MRAHHIFIATLLMITGISHTRSADNEMSMTESDFKEACKITYSDDTQESKIVVSLGLDRHCDCMWRRVSDLPHFTIADLERSESVCVREAMSKDRSIDNEERTGLE